MSDSRIAGAPAKPPHGPAFGATAPPAAGPSVRRFPRLRDLKVGTRMRLGIGVILAMVMLLGAVAWYQGSRLWEETRGLYEHPLTVRRALDAFKTDVLSIHGDMHDLILSQSEAERQTLLQEIVALEADAAMQIDILYDRYLGPGDDVNHVRNLFEGWKPLRAETVRLILAGNAGHALDRMKPTGVEGRQMDRLMADVRDVSDFAHRRADVFYAEAQRHRESMAVYLAILLAAILALATGVGWALISGLVSPLRQLTAAAEAYRKGDLDARSGYVASNELGMLSESFNALAETVQGEMLSREGTARVSEIMLRESELRSFCRELLKALYQQTGSQVGAIYLLNDGKTDFEHFESIGLSAGCRDSFSASGLEGEFGAALSSRGIQHLREIPEDSRFGYATVSGEFRPREILTIPILSESEVVAMVSLASIRSYTRESIRLVEDVWGVLTARLNGVLASQRIRDFSERLEGQNRELDEQKRELLQQKDELQEQNLELELQKRQLDEANRLKSTFLSNMSHELRTPLNSVIALSGVLGRRLRNAIPEEEYGYLDVIERNGRNLLALINDILDLSRIEAGREEVTIRPFRIDELIAEITATINPQAREKGISLVNRTGADLPPIRSDRTKCRHILQNLVANAVKFTERGGVEVGAEPADGYVRIAVADTGIGIPADKIPFIFDEFRQADESTSRNHGGTGLGLAIAKKYAVLLGGSIEVRSEPGKGSTFVLVLPLSLEEWETGERGAHGGGDSSTAPPPGSSAVAAGKGRTLLLVEDNESAIVQMLDILQGKGYRVRVAGNGREALEQVGLEVPDGLILDLMMPEVDGFQVLRELRGEEKTKAVPVLILTARHVTTEELKFLKGNHIHQLIQKGDIRRQELLSAIAGMFRAGPDVREGHTPRFAPSPKGSDRPLILAVEDDASNLLTIRALLADRYRVEGAPDGRQGLELARLHKPTLILMDIAMPVMNGFEALEAIRSDPELRDIPVVALTARAMKEDREKILAYGFDGYVAKPIDNDLLHRTLREMLHER